MTDTSTAPRNGTPLPPEGILASDVGRKRMVKRIQEGLDKKLSEQIIRRMVSEDAIILNECGEDFDYQFDRSYDELTLTNRVKLYTITDKIAQEYPEFQIEGIIPQGPGVGIIAGASGSMKTFLLLHLMLMLANGTNLGTIKVKKSGVVVLNNEGQAGYGKRLDAALKHLDIPAPDNFVIGDVTPDLLHGKSVDPFIDTIKQLPFSIGAIVIDNFSKASFGGDDNNTSDMAEAMDMAYCIADQTGAFVLLVDHIGKDAKKGLRGAYSKHANADMVAMVSKNSDGVTLKTIKQKEAEDGLLFNFAIHKVPDADSLCVTYRGSVEEAADRYAKAFGQKDFIRLHLEEHGSTERDDVAVAFCEAFGFEKKKSFNTQLQRVCKSGEVINNEGVLELV